MAVVEDQLYVASELEAVCNRFKIKRLRLFGSAARGELQADSDIDVIVDFDSGHKASGLDWLDLFEALSDVFSGRHVDALSVDQLHWVIRRSVLESARTIYEK